MRTSTDAAKRPRRIQMENSVAVTVDAGVDEVWNVVRDVTRVGEWSHECVDAAWMGDATSAVPGARFRGRNRAGIIRWGRVCEVVSADPYELVWRTVPTVLYPDSSEWRITLDEVDNGTRISQHFRVLRAPKILAVVYAMLIPAHRDRSAKLVDDLQRLGAVARGSMSRRSIVAMRQTNGANGDRVPEALDLAATQRALRSAAQRTAALLKEIRDPNIRAAGLDWTIAETAAHLVATLDHYTGWVTGERDPAVYLEASRHAGSTSERSAIVGARLLAEFQERDIDRLAEMLVPTVERFIAEGQGRDSDVAFMTWTGVAMTIPMMTAAMLGEELLHGLDIARSVRAPWTISRRDAILVIEGVVAMLPAYLDKEKAAGVHVAYELRLRGGPRYRIAIDDRTAVVATAGARVDCWISADPVAFLLVGYGRAGQWSQSLRGKIIVGGRKPWLGLRFSDYTSGP